MHLDGRTRLRLGTAANRSSRWLAVLFPFSIVGSVLGQGYLVPPQGYQGAPAVPSMGNVSGSSGSSQGKVNTQTLDEFNARANGEPIGQNGNGQANPQPNGEAAPTAEGDTTGATAAPLAAPLTSLMGWGALHLHARASYQFSYATGIHSGPGNDDSTITHTFTPGVTLDLGPHVTFDYSPSFRIYSQKDFHNTIDHAFSLRGGVHYGDWTLGTFHTLSISDDPLVETSTQTRQIDYTAGLSAAYQLSEKISLATTAGANLLFVGSTNIVATNGVGGSSSLTDSTSVYGGESFNYSFDEKISSGVGVTISYAEQGRGFRSIDEQYDGHLSWRPGNKLNAVLSAGIERRDFLNEHAGTAWNPIYSASIGYHVFEQTTVSLYANRTVGSSLFQRQIVENTSVGVGFQQRLLGKLQLSLGFGYTKADYKLTTTNLSTSRSDEGTSYSAGLSLPFLTHCNFSTYYQYSQNSSSANGFGFSSSQLGATLSWAY